MRPIALTNGEGIFRPEYGRLKEVREALGSPPVLAFTATAGQEMQARILESLGIPDAEVFVRGVDRPNIALLRWSVPVDERPGVIAQLCRASNAGQGQGHDFCANPSRLARRCKSILANKD